MEPGLDARIQAAAGRLAAEPDVVAVYLFGSMARGEQRRRSDVDLAVLFRESVSLQRELRLGVMAGETTGREVDLIVLNRAPPLLAFRAVHRGRLLASNDDSVRLRHAAQVAAVYMDTAPLRRSMAAGLQRRLREGTFGRP